MWEGHNSQHENCMLQEHSDNEEHGQCVEGHNEKNMNTMGGKEGHEYYGGKEGHEYDVWEGHNGYYIRGTHWRAIHSIKNRFCSKLTM